MGKVLVVVDMQVDFVNGSLGTKEAEEIVPFVIEKVEKEKSAGTEVIFTKDTHETAYLQSQEGKKLPVEHCIRGSRGWEIIDQLKPYAKDTKIIEKPTFGSVKLPKYVENADVIELIGLCTDICVISNALLLKAHYPEKIIQVDASCCAGVTVESHRNAIEAMKMCQIDILGEQVKIQEADENLGKEENQKKVVIQTFGHFQVFVGTEPVKFKRSKSKELLAFLVDRRGAGVTNAEIASILYEDKEYNRSIKNQVQTVITQMLEALRTCGVDDIIIKPWNSISIDISKVQCDYYDFLEREKRATVIFTGEYMVNYSWAEYTNGYLMQLQRRDENEKR